MSAINPATNPIIHSKTKYIKVRHQSNRGHINNNNIELCFIY